MPTNDQIITLRLRTDGRGAITEIQRHNAALGDMDDRFGATASSSRKFNNAIATVGTTALSAKSALAGLGLTLGTVFAARGIKAAITGTIELSDAWTQYKNAIRSVTETNVEFNEAQDSVFKLSKELRIGIDSTAAVFQKLSKSLEDTGASTADIIQLEKTMIQLGKSGGKSSEEVSAGLLQLTQGFESGRIQGDEFRSGMENLSPVMKFVREQLGLTASEFRELSSAGGLTTELFVGALSEGADEAAASFQDMESTVGEAGTSVIGSMTRVIGRVDDLVGGSDLLKTSFEGLASALDAVAEGLDRTDSANAQRNIEEVTEKIEFFREQIRLLDDGSQHSQIRIKLYREEIKRLGGTVDDLEQTITGNLLQALDDADHGFRSAADAAEQANESVTDLDELFKSISGNMSVFMDQARQEALAWGNVAKTVAGIERELFDEGRARARKAARDAEIAQRKAINDLYRNATAQLSIFNAQVKEEALAWGNVDEAVKEVIESTREMEAQLDASLDEFLDKWHESDAEMRDGLISLASAWGDFFNHIDAEWADVLGNMFAGFAALIRQLESSGGQVSFGNLGSIAAAGGVGGGIGSQFGGQGGLGGAIGGIAGGLFGSSTTFGSSAIGTALGNAFGTAVLPVIGTIVGSVAGGLLGSLFGGGREPSPEISIGGAQTATGIRAGTQARSPFGTFGLRDPSGPDDFGALLQIGQLIANAEVRMAQFLTESEVSMIETVQSALSTTMDSDDPREVSAAIGVRLRESLRTLGQELGDTFDELTGDLRGSTPEDLAATAVALAALHDSYRDGEGIITDVGSASEAATAIMEHFATGIQTLDQALDEVVLTFALLDQLDLESGTVAALDFGRAFVDAMGGIESAVAGVQDVFEHFFSPAEIAQIALEAANQTLQENFGDLIEQGLNASNFRQYFDSVRDTLGPEALAHLIAFGNQLGVIMDLESDLSDIRQAELSAILEAANETREASEAAAEAAAEAAIAMQEFMDRLVEGAQRTADAANDAIRSIRGLQGQRSGLVGDLFHMDSASGIFARGQRSPLDAFLDDITRIRFEFENWDGSIESLQELNSEMLNFQQAAANLAASIQTSISSIRSSAENAVFDIDRDIARITGGSQGEYDFIQGVIQDINQRLAVATDPTEIAQLTARRNQLGRDAWALLTDEQRIEFGDQFRQFFIGGADASVSVLETIQSTILGQSELLLSDTAIIAATIEAQTPIFEEIRDLIDEIPDEIVQGMIRTLFPDKSAEQAAIDKAAELGGGVAEFNAATSAFGSHVGRFGAHVARADAISRRPIRVRVSNSNQVMLT